MRDSEPRGSNRRYDTMLGVALAGRDHDPATVLGTLQVALPGDSEGLPPPVIRSRKDLFSSVLISRKNTEK